MTTLQDSYSPLAPILKQCDHAVALVLQHKPRIKYSSPVSHYFGSLILITITGIDMSVRNAQGSTSSIQTKRGMVLPFQPLSLTFNHVNYYVDMPAVSHLFPSIHVLKYFVHS